MTLSTENSIITTEQETLILGTCIQADSGSLLHSTQPEEIRVTCSHAELQKLILLGVLIIRREKLASGN